MGEKRLVDRDVFHSPDLLPLPATGRLLWIGMVVCCSREGLIRANESFLKALILPSLRHGRANIRHYIDHLKANCMLYERHIDGVKYYQLTNFRKYQKLGEERRGEEMTREEGEAPSAQAPSIPLSPFPPDSRSLKDRWMATLAKWGLALKARARASEAFGRNQPTEDDLREWNEFYLLACQRSVAGQFPNDPKSYTRGLMAKHKSPQEADVGFWRRRKGSEVPTDHPKRKIDSRYLSAPPEAIPLSELAEHAKSVKAGKKEGV